MSVNWMWEDEGWSEFTDFAGDMGEALLDPLQAYVPGVDMIIDTINYAQDSNPENLADIFVPEEFEGVVDVAGDYGPGGQNNTSYIFPDPQPVKDPLNTAIPMDTDLDEDPVEDDPSWASPEEPSEDPVPPLPLDTTVFDDAWEHENDEEEIDFTFTQPPVVPPVIPSVVSSTSHCCCCCCCPCRCS